MLISQIVKRVNEFLDGETVSYSRLLPHLDQVIDDINQTLNTVYPVFSDLPAGTLSYDCFPDRYQRGVICRGAAVYFYMTDEEGGQPPSGYMDMYHKSLFEMLRDYIHLVPDEFKTKTTAGTVSLNLMGAHHSTDDVDPNCWRI